MIKVRAEVWPFLALGAALGGAVALAVRWGGTGWGRAAWIGAGAGAVVCAYMLYFFRDPDRLIPGNPAMIVAGADGRIAGITRVREDRFLREETVRISVFLSLFDVHVNRAPIAGTSTFLGYFPGRRFFTFREKSSTMNQHNAILLEGERTRCLVTQIVGPVCRRVAYFLDHDQGVRVRKGDRIGMMKFGSRLDMYFPKDDIEVVVKKGDVVRAGQTVVARLREQEERP